MLKYVFYEKKFYLEEGVPGAAAILKIGPTMPAILMEGLQTPRLTMTERWQPSVFLWSLPLDKLHGDQNMIFQGGSLK